MPFGGYGRSNPVVFSPVPRCHGLSGSQNLDGERRFGLRCKVQSASRLQCSGRSATDVPKLMSKLGFFYIGRMLTLDVDLLPVPLRAKIITSETGAGDTNYINGRRVSGVTGAIATVPAREVVARYAHGDRAQACKAVRAAANAFSQWRLDLPCKMICTEDGCTLECARAGA